MRLYRNMRLRNRALQRGPLVRKAAAAETKEPTSYPLQSGAWSSCDESSEDETIGETVAKVLKLREPLGERKRGWASSAVNGKECPGRCQRAARLWGGRIGRHLGGEERELLF